MHNDIKPQNYLVKFRNNDEKPSDIEIVLTDFGLAGSESKGGTPVFGSPECWTDRKDKSSDIFSLGRVFLMVILPIEKFLKFLFVPIFKGQKRKMMKLIDEEPILSLISKMMRIRNRIDLQTIRKELKEVSKIKCSDNIIKKISEKIKASKTEYGMKYPKRVEKYMNVLQNLT